MNLTCLTVGDPHFKIDNVRETQAMAEAVLKKARELTPDLIVVLGDTLDRHESIHVSPLVRAIDFLSQLRTISPLVLLIGNHDRRNNSDFLSDEHPFSSLKEWGTDVTVVDTTKVVMLKGHLLVFVPYVPPGLFNKALNKIDYRGCTAIFAHQEFKGAKMGSVISIVGDEWPLTSPLIISGHIHEYQQPQENIIYVGTPLQHAFGDSDDKTISLFVFGEGTYQHRRIDLGLPKKYMVRLSASDVPDYVPPENRLIKLIITGTTAELQNVKKLTSITKWKELGIKIAYRDIPLLKMPNSTSVKTERFSSLLYQCIGHDETLRQTFHEVLGKPT